MEEEHLPLCPVAPGVRVTGSPLSSRNGACEISSGLSESIISAAAEAVQNSLKFFTDMENQVKRNNPIYYLAFTSRHIKDCFSPFQITELISLACGFCSEAVRPKRTLSSGLPKICIFNGNDT